MKENFTSIEMMYKHLDLLRKDISKALLERQLEASKRALDTSKVLYSSIRSIKALLQDNLKEIKQEKKIVVHNTEEQLKNEKQ